MAKNPGGNRSAHTTIRLNKASADIMVKVVEHNQTSLTTEVNTAVREKLERLGLWPPKEADDGGDKRRPADE